MLSLRNLTVSVADRMVLSDVSLKIRPRELHVLMGPNGSGKSSLAQTIAGNPKFGVSSGSIRLGRLDLLRRSPDERARLGLFVAFQQPLAIPGVGAAQFMRIAFEQRNGELLRPSQVRQRLWQALPQAGLPSAVMDRELNVGFSGGEQKRFELAQLLLLGAKIAVLDEMDSGLDVDGIHRIAAGVEAQRKAGTGILFITHNPVLLEVIEPNGISLLVGGRIVSSGGIELARQIAQRGFAFSRED